MKGKTIIELKDVRSGKVQRVEHGNTFQSEVISDLFKTYGALNINFLNAYRSRNNLWQILTGGLLLFDDTIEAGTWYPPQDVNMVGNASYNVLNSGDPNEMGSWNDSESYVTKDEIVMTYDFTTSQANGSIASVALTSAMGGYIGVGNGSETYKTMASGGNTPFAIGTDINAHFINAGYFHLFDGEYFYEVEMTSPITSPLKVHKKYTNSKGVDLIRGLSSTEEFVDVYDIGLSESYTNGQVISETELALWSESNGTYKAIVVDVKTKNVSSVYTIPKLSDVAWAEFVHGSDTLEMWQHHVLNGEQYISVYDCSTNTWVSDAEWTNLYNNNRLATVSKVGDRRYYTRYGDFLIMCERNNVLVPLNGMNYTSSSTAWWRKSIKLWQGGSYGQYVFKNNIYLATINNLEEPVVKDNTKTMKITYVLTRR